MDQIVFFGTVTALCRFAAIFLMLARLARCCRHCKTLDHVDHNVLASKLVALRLPDVIVR